MRILFDECAPRRLGQSLPGHDTLTVPEMGWSGKTNGELMRLIAARGFDVFLTVDQNVQFQQNLQSAPFAVIVLAGTSNRLADLLPLLPQLLAALAQIRPGDLVVIKPQFLAAPRFSPASETFFRGP